MKYLNTLSEFETQIADDKLTVVDFTASWCGPCQNIAPFYEELSQKYPNATFVKVDVDDGEAVAEKYGINSMPTFHFYIKGERVAEFSGASQQMLVETIEKNIK